MAEHRNDSSHDVPAFRVRRDYRCGGVSTLAIAFGKVSG